MTLGDRVASWNRQYKRIPEQWRFQFVLWPLLAVGMVNMMLTVAAGFPFALLVLLAVLCLAAIRVPYLLGWVAAPELPESDQGFQIPASDRLIDLNLRYEAMPESRRIWVYPAVLLIGGAINMMLTIAFGFPFGLLFLLTLLALIAVRAPYTAGWLKPQVEAGPAGTPTAPNHDAPAAVTEDPGPSPIAAHPAHASPTEPAVEPSVPAYPTSPPPTEQSLEVSPPANPAPPSPTEQEASPPPHPAPPSVTEHEASLPANLASQPPTEQEASPPANPASPPLTEQKASPPANPAPPFPTEQEASLPANPAPPSPTDQEASLPANPAPPFPTEQAVEPVVPHTPASPDAPVPEQASAPPPHGLDVSGKAAPPE